MRVLHLADTHLGAHLHAWGAPPGWHRSQDHLCAFEQALAPALRGEVDLVVHGGDLFDHRQPGKALIARVEALLAAVAARVPVVLVPGNHDPPSLLRAFRIPPPGLHVVDLPTRLVFGELALGIVPFRRRLEGFLDALPEAVGPGVDALVLHQAVDGCRVPGFVFRVEHPAGTVGAAHLPRGVRHLFGGHLHPRQAVRLGEAEMVYPGATVRTAAREGPEPKGYALWGWGRRVTWRFVDLPERGFSVVRDAADLLALRSEQLVVIQEGADYRDLFFAALARGAWVVGRHPDQERRARRGEAGQLRLFPR
ncbi:MAG: metallophosphoesterase [Pseudomonadota bacterium]